jgi:tRNA dimethylallyltransferase
MLTGKPLSWWQRVAKLESPIVPWYVRLTAPRAVLHRRIEDRVERMLGGGLVEEVQALLDYGIPFDAPGLDAVGYREVLSYLRGEIQSAELAGKICSSTKRYAKRQETWFRHQLRDVDVQLMDVTDGALTLAARFAELWEKWKDQCESG